MANAELVEAMRGRLIDIAIGQHDVVEDKFEDIAPLRFHVVGVVGCSGDDALDVLAVDGVGAMHPNQRGK